MEELQDAWERKRERKTDKNNFINKLTARHTKTCRKFEEK